MLAFCFILTRANEKIGMDCQLSLLPLRGFCLFSRFALVFASLAYMLISTARRHTTEWDRQMGIQFHFAALAAWSVMRIPASCLSCNLFVLESLTVAALGSSKQITDRLGIVFLRSNGQILLLNLKAIFLPALDLSFQSSDTTQSLSLAIDYSPGSGGLLAGPGYGGARGHFATWTAPNCAPAADAPDYWLQLSSEAPQTRCNPLQRGLAVTAAAAAAGTNVRACSLFWNARALENCKVLLVVRLKYRKCLVAADRARTHRCHCVGSFSAG